MTDSSPVADGDALSPSAADIEARIASLRRLGTEGEHPASVSLQHDPCAAFLTPLLTAMQDESIYIRTSVVYSLEAYDKDDGSPKLQQALVKALSDDPADEVRVAAAQSLGHHAFDDGVQALADALTDACAEVRSTAAYSLARLCERDGLDEEDLVGILMPRLSEEPDPQARCNVILALECLRSEHAVEGLLLAVSDVDADVRAAALSTLNRYGHEFGAEEEAACIHALSDSSDAVRSEAATRLRWGTTKGVPALMAAINDPSADVRARVTDALGRLEAVEATDVLADRLLNDPDEDVRGNAAEALGQLKTQRATALLLTASSEQSPQVRRRRVRAELDTSMGSPRAARRIGG